MPFHANNKDASMQFRFPLNSHHATHRKQVADDHREADGQSRAAPELAAGVAGGEDGEDQMERDQQLHGNASQHRHVGIQLQKSTPPSPGHCCLRSQATREGVFVRHFYTRK